MTRSKIINILSKNKNLLKKQFHILKIGLFGSYSSNSFSQDSDIDLVFELEEGKKLGLRDMYELEIFFKQLFKIDKIDLINHKYMNPIIEHEASKTMIYV